MYSLIAYFWHLTIGFVYPIGFKETGSPMTLLSFEFGINFLSFYLREIKDKGCSAHKATNFDHRSWGLYDGANHTKLHRGLGLLTWPRKAEPSSCCQSIRPTRHSCIPASLHPTIQRSSAKGCWRLRTEPNGRGLDQRLELCFELN